jgi:hypothetical protein
MINKLNKFLQKLDIKLVRDSAPKLQWVPYSENLLGLITISGSSFVTPMPLEKLRIFSGLVASLTPNVNIWSKSLQEASIGPC